MKRIWKSRALAWVLSFAMLFSLLPVGAMAAEAQTFTQVTSIDEITAGSYLVYSTGASATGDGLTGGFMTAENKMNNRLYSTQLEITGNTASTNDSYCIWNFAESGDGYTIQNAEDNSYLCYNGTGNAVFTSETASTGAVWKITAASGGTFNVTEPTNNRSLYCNRFGSGNYYIGFACYTNTNRSVQLFKLGSGGGATTPKAARPQASEASGSVFLSGKAPEITLSAEGAEYIYYTRGTASVEPTDPGAPGADVYSGPLTLSDGTNKIKAIAYEGGKDPSDVAAFTYEVVSAVTMQQAIDLAEGEFCAVEGVVNSLDGKNVTIQAGDKGIQLYFSQTPSVTEGQTITVYGKKQLYYGMPQLGSAAMLDGPTAGTPITPAALDITKLNEAAGKESVLVAPSAGGYTAGAANSGTGFGGYTYVTHDDTSTQFSAKFLGEKPAEGDKLTITKAVVSRNGDIFRLIVPADGYTIVPPAVEDVTASPEAGAVTLTPSFDVTLSCATDGAVIHYTTDGSEPDENTAATVASGGKVSVTSLPFTIKAIAVKGADKSNVETFKYTKKVEATPGKGPVILYEVYGAGGNSGAVYNADYFVLKNISSEAVDISGWSLQYGSATTAGNTAFSKIYPLEHAVIPAGGYYLVQASAPSAVNGKELPKWDESCDLGLGGSSGQVALATDSVGVTGPSATNVADFLGYGTAARYFGTGAAPAQSAKLSSVRTTTGFGGTYTPDNKNDYESRLPDLDYLGRATLSVKASPSAGAVLSGTQVTLSTSVADAVIYCTTDGTAPQKVESNKYVSPITITANTTIKALISSPTLGDSPVAEFAYTIATPKTIAEVRAIAGSDTNPPMVITSGIVTYIDVSASTYGIQDATGGIAARITNTDGKGTPKVGDQVQVAGGRQRYNALEQINNCTLLELKTGGAQTITLPEPPLKTLEELQAKQGATGTAVNFELYESQQIRLKALVLGAEAPTGTTTATDQSGKTVDLRKATYPDGLGEGDLVDMVAVVSQYDQETQYKGYQLYVGRPEDITAAVDEYAPMFDTTKLGVPALGKDYEIVVIVTDSSGVDEASVKVDYAVSSWNDVGTVIRTSGTTALTTASASTGVYRGTIPAAKLAGGFELSLQFSAKDKSPAANEGGPTVTKAIDGKPRFTAVTPAANSGTGDELRPVISASFENVDAGAAVSMKLDGADVAVTPTLNPDGTGTVSYTPGADMSQGSHTAAVTVARATGDTTPVTRTWTFYIGTPSFNRYFGQMHSHTGDSDGIGTVEQAFEHARGVADLDFLAVTDHSNMLGMSSATSDLDITELEQSTSEKWKNQHTAADTYTDEDFVAMLGWEMTWNGSKPGATSSLNQSGAAGHMNTYNVPWIASREDLTMTLEKYYDKLVQPENAQAYSQFNHPGTTFGDFYSFDQWNPARDSAVTMIEVGNGEGAIGSSGYFPSYEYFTKALDKGWHLAPTNNQDNHKGNWGDSNTGRSVALATELTREAIDDAYRNMRAYATEDSNLDITYFANGQPMGSTLGSDDDPVSEIDFEFLAQDLSGDAIAKVELVSNGGLVVGTLDLTGAEPSATYKETVTGDTAGVSAEGAVDWRFTLPAGNSYYYFRVTEADKDLAVTAPVWTGAMSTIGIDKVTCDKPMALVGEDVTLTVSVYNTNYEDMTIRKLEVLSGDVSLAMDDSLNVAVGASGSVSIRFAPAKAGLMSLTIKLTAVVGGVSKEYITAYSLTAKAASATPIVMLDAYHNNAYVSGYYENNYTAFQGLITDKGAMLVLNDKPFDEADLSNVDVLVIPDAHGRTGDSIQFMTYSDAEVAAVKAYVDAGGGLILTSLADYKDTKATSNEKYSNGYQTNVFLEALDSVLRVGDDELCETVTTGTQNYRLFLTDYNFADPFGLTANTPHEKDDSGNDQEAYQGYSFYSGCSVYMTGERPTATWLVGAGGKAYGGTGAQSAIYSYDADNDGAAGGLPPADAPIYVLAAEEFGGGGKVAVGGTSFFSDFEIGSSSVNMYSNNRLLSNILDWMLLEEMTIAEAKKDEVHNDTGAAGADGIPDRFESLERVKVTGYVTTESMGETQAKNLNNAFFDTIYVQDATGGITVFGVSGRRIPVGAKITLTGVIDGYQGDYELAISDENGDVVVHPQDQWQTLEPDSVTTGSVRDGANMGSLVLLRGTVKSFGLNGDLGADNAIVLDDGTGPARVFLDGYVGSSRGTAALYGKWDSNIKVGDTVTAVGLVSTDPLGNRIRVRDTEEIVRVSGGSTGGNSGGSGGPAAQPELKPSDVKVTDGGVEIELPGGGATLNQAAEEKVVAENADKDVTIKAPGMNVTIPAGTLGQGDSVNDMLVTPKKGGNAIRVTYADGTTAILPFAVVDDASAGYLANMVGKYEIIDNSKTFPDLPEDHWAASAIDFVSAHEFFQGDTAGNFNPEEPMTRAMLVTVLSRIHGAKGGTGTFEDVASDAWYADAVAWAAEQKLVEGDGVNFAPDASVTREQLCAILARYLEYAGLTLDASGTDGEYADMDAVSGWAKDSVELALKTGLISGKPGGMIDPQGQATRAEIATILQRFVEKVVG